MRLWNGPLGGFFAVTGLNTQWKRSLGDEEIRVIGPAIERARQTVPGGRTISG